MSNGNGQADQGPPFFVVGAPTIMSRDRIIEELTKSRLVQAKADLASGPVFDNTIDRFRKWSKKADPGWMFTSSELDLVVIRLATAIPITAALSDAARKQAEAAQAEPPPSDRPLIFHE